VSQKRKNRLTHFLHTKILFWFYTLRNTLTGRTAVWLRYTDEDFAHIAKTISPIAHLAPKQTILDVGCGNGGMSLGFLRQEPTLSTQGVDIMTSSVARAKKLIPDGKFVVSSAADLSHVESGSIDLTACFGVLTFMPKSDIVKAAREMLRVTKPGGYIWIGGNLEERDAKHNWGHTLLPNDYWKRALKEEHALVTYYSEDDLFGIKKYSPHQTTVIIQKKI